MQRITSSDQMFHDGDPFNGIQGTVVTAQWLNSVQEEIVSVITAAGIPLNAGQSNQLLAAIRSVINNSSVGVVTTGGTTILSAAQLAPGFIVVTGALTSNASLIVPAALGKWIIVNATTGNFTLGCYATGGSGVPISQGALDAVACDGINVKYQMDDAATKTNVQSSSLVYAAGGGTANAHSANYMPAVTALTDGMILTFKALTTNNGATTFTPNGLPPKPVVGGAHAALQGGEIVAGGEVEVMWHASLNSWVLLGCTGGALQVGTATQSQHAVPLNQVQSLVVGAIGMAYVNGARTLAAGTYLVDTAVATFTLLLPAAPDVGTTITLIDATANWAARNWTLGRNGKTIMGQAADLTVDVKDQQFSIWYNGSDWRLV